MRGHFELIGILGRSAHTFGRIRGRDFYIEVAYEVVEILRALFPVPLIETCPLKCTLTGLISGTVLNGDSISLDTGFSIDDDPLLFDLLLSLHLFNQTLHELLVVKQRRLHLLRHLILSDYIVQLLIHLALRVEVLHEHLSPTCPVVIRPAQTEALSVHLISAESQRRGVFDQQKLGASIRLRRRLFNRRLRYRYGVLSVQQSILTLIGIIQAEAFSWQLNALAEDRALSFELFLDFSPV